MNRGRPLPHVHPFATAGRVDHKSNPQVPLPYGAASSALFPPALTLRFSYACLSAAYSSQVMTVVWVGEANSIMAVAMSSYSSEEAEQASVG